ncbi:MULTISPECIES: helix-turn-helix domain-containing protein [Actinomadura]|uniref:Helix-turn-helix domain-containing protein n=1 Tax=Actinomadura yumaensis TaxID=111807 RepID=A0ABW2CS99_9ACTN|nr:helix-turn-helix domain-containing protein [Actinomadura sp. J1-007]
MNDPSRTLLTVAQAAERAGVGASTVRQWVRRGHLPVVRLAGRVWVRELDLLIAERDTRRRGGARRGAEAAGPVNCGGG